MANYHVTKDKESKEWNVKKEGADRKSGSFDTQREAEQAAKKFAGRSGGGEVRVHRPNGPIRDSDTIAPGKDPNPPKDKKH